MIKILGIVLLVLAVVVIIPLIIVAVAIGFSGGSGFGCDPAGGTGGSGTTDTAAGGTPVYLIGDSIGVGVEPELRTELGGKLTAQVTGGITLHDSLPKLEGDKDKIRKANSVVVELGTNLNTPTGSFANEAKEMVNKIRAINPNAKIYWVQIFSEGSADEYRQYNDIIRGLPGVEVIETKGKGITFADGEVPIGIHPSPKGYEILAKLIANEVTGGGPTSSILRSLVGAAYAAPTNPPKKFIPYYQGAAAQFGLGELGPSILAALHFTETGYSTNLPDPGGAYVGPMAIIKADWQDTWGVDGDKDGDKDIFSEPDAIYAAAKILKYCGGSKDWRETISKYKGGSYSLADQALEYAKDHPIPATGSGTVPVGGGGGGGEDCEPAEDGSAGGGSVSGDVQQLAQEILKLIKDGKVGQSYKSDTGDTMAQLRRAANGQKFQMTCVAHGGPKNVDVNPNILKAIIESANQGAYVDISNITDKCHSGPSSPHYIGAALDLTCNTRNIEKIHEVSKKYGGTNNYEVCPGAGHWHIDFPK